VEQVTNNKKGETKMAKNTLQEECIKCQNIYSTNMNELKMNFISVCPNCKTGVANEWSKVCSGAYLQSGKVGA